MIPAVLFAVLPVLEQLPEPMFHLSSLVDRPLVLVLMPPFEVCYLHQKDLPLILWILKGVVKLVVELVEKKMIQTKQSVVDLTLVQVWVRL